MLSLLVELRLSSWLVIRSSFEIWNTPPPMVEVSLSFLKTLKLVGKMSPFFIDEFSQYSVPQMKSGLCRLFSTSMSAAFFLMLWQLIRMQVWSLSCFKPFVVSSILWWLGILNFDLVNIIKSIKLIWCKNVCIIKERVRKVKVITFWASPWTRGSNVLTACIRCPQCYNSYDGSSWNSGHSE